MEVNAGEVLSEDVANTLNERPNLERPSRELSLAPPIDAATAQDESRPKSERRRRR